jgi:peptide/nickel transport system permease protein
MSTASAAMPGAITPPSGRRSLGSVVWRAITRKPGRIVGILIILGFAFMAIFGPMFYPKQLPINPAELYAPPSWAHPLGTDFEGTSVLAEIITGSRYVLEAAALAALFTVGFGTIAGITSGYYLGTTDQVIMRVTDFILTIPGFPLLIVLSTIWSFGSPIAMGLVLGLTGWGGLARAVRSQTLSLRERGFIEAAKGLGLSNRHVISREILPNISPYIAMNLLLSVTGGIYAEVGLFFLGVIPFQSNNWGVMLNLAFGNGAMYTPQALLYMLSPMACILLVTFGIVLTLDALDEILNPRLREG